MGPGWGGGGDWGNQAVVVDYQWVVVDAGGWWAHHAWLSGHHGLLHHRPRGDYRRGGRLPGASARVVVMDRLVDVVGTNDPETDAGSGLELGSDDFTVFVGVLPEAAPDTVSICLLLVLLPVLLVPEVAERRPFL